MNFATTPRKIYGMIHIFLGSKYWIEQEKFIWIKNSRILINTNIFLSICKYKTNFLQEARFLFLIERRASSVCVGGGWGRRVICGIDVTYRNQQNKTLTKIKHLAPSSLISSFTGHPVWDVLPPLHPKENLEILNLIFELSHHHHNHNHNHKCYPIV